MAMVLVEPLTRRSMLSDAVSTPLPPLRDRSRTVFSPPRSRWVVSVPLEKSPSKPRSSAAFELLSAVTVVVPPVQVAAQVPLSQVASVAVADARSLTITPWEKQIVGAVEKAILASDLGLTPNTAGTVIRLNLPALTEERRKELSKVVHGEGEDAKVAIRNIRRDANQQVKELLKEKQVSEDEAARSEAEIQKLTDKAIKDVDDVVKAKEQELMAV